MRTINLPRKTKFGRLLQLEDRVAPATFTVTNTGDGTDSLGNPFLGTLRWAIMSGNDSMTWGAGPHTINFTLPGPSYTINALTGFPASLYPVTINGRSQPGYVGRPIVEITGTPTGDCIVALAGNCKISSLIINGFANGNGVYLGGDNNLVEGCYIGTDRTGKVNMGNGWGVRIDSAMNCTIGGPDADDRNIISGSAQNGIQIDAAGSGKNTIVNNYVGTDVTGMTAIPNGTGMVLTGNGYTIGGATANLRNLVAGNNYDGIGIGVSDVGTIQGNHIGTNLPGTAALPNGGYGVLLHNSTNYLVGGSASGVGNIISGNKGTGLGITVCGPSNTVQGNLIGTAIDGKTPMGNGSSGVYINNSSKVQVGGSGSGQGNVISANGVHGIGLDFIDVPAGSGVTIQGNMIGVDETGTIAIGNKSTGVFFLTAKNCIIGGTGPGAGNVISDNDDQGIFFGFNFPYGSNTIQGNTIGAAKGNLPLVGGSQKIGIHIFGSATNQVGGLAAGAANFIAGNSDYGLLLEGGTFSNKIEANTIQYNGYSLGAKGHGIEIVNGSMNRISRNSIHDNWGRGIDLNNDWVTINDPLDTDTGKANELQDYPFLLYRPQGAADKGVHTWKLNSTPNLTFTVEIFENPGLDPAEYGEGSVYITQKSVTTNASGDATFTFDHTGKSFITMTATDPSGNTSEFSLIDTDADALADVWELAGGLDIDQDGTLTANEKILTGAKRDHKDLFVEVDAMAGRVPEAAIFNAATLAKDGGVINAFAMAPDSLVHNPDQLDGVTLHATLDETNLTLTAFSVPDQYWKAYDNIKNGTIGNGTDGKFGTVIQRADPNWVNIRSALKITYRYCMFADQFSWTNTNTMKVITGSSGVAEIGGNDFMVTVRPNAWGKATQVDRAGTFMHELGHTLGLRHGGGDNTQNKPNYFSVMNYSWQIPDSNRRPTAPVTLPSYANSWELDYSRVAYPDLAEAALNEAAGIGGRPGKFVPFWNQTGAQILAPEFGPVDWKTNLVLENPVTVDINNDGVLGKLAGHEDWSGLLYSFVDSKESGDGIHTEFDPNELPTEATTAPKVQFVTINNGQAQRSRVTSVTLDFDQIVTLPTNPADAFSLIRQSDSAAVGLSATVTEDAVTHVTLTFFGTATEFSSLADGRYTLSALASKISGPAGSLDGDGNGAGGDNFVLASAVAPNPPTNIFRLFGDADGDGTVAANDFIQFRLALGGTSTIFDFDNDGAVAASDFIQFRLRFGGSI